MNNTDSDSRVLDESRKFISPILWGFVALVGTILGTVYFNANTAEAPGSHMSMMPPEINRVTDATRDSLYGSVRNSMKESRRTAQEFAESRMNDWTDQLKMRVDGDFLDWYFDYVQQQKMGLMYLGNKAKGAWTGEDDLAENELMNYIQSEFSDQVMRPEIARYEVERIAEETAQVYIQTLQDRLVQIPIEYNLTDEEWGQYLDDITKITYNTEGNRDFPFALKTLYGAGAFGAVTVTSRVARGVGRSTVNAGGKVIGRTAGAVAVNASAKMGKQAGRKIAGKVLGAAIGVGLIIWEIWDYNETVAVERPRLSQQLNDYLEEVEKELLYDSEAGILTVLDDLESEVRATMRY
ncbi:MAG: hypothetical protein KTR29_00530 [Rhodothermaceae bacterium]|nr:hypothetical protein [Rhodothermaceae bacterium]